MDINDALRILGLPAGATPNEIESTYRALARKHHPDAGGDSARMSELNVAHDVAIAAASASLVPLNKLAALVEEASAKLVLRAEIREASQAAVASATESATSWLRSMRWASLALLTLSGIALFLGNGALDFIADKTLVAHVQPLMKLIYTMGTIAAGGAWVLTQRIKWTELQIEELSLFLGERENFFDLWCSILPTDRVESEITKGELSNFAATWAEVSVLGSKHYETFTPHRSWRKLARRMGFNDFANLFVRKGIEIGVLVRNDRWRDGRPIEALSLRHLEEPQIQKEMRVT